MDSFTGSLGVRLFTLLEKSGWRFHPHAGVSLVHQFKNDAVSLTTSFADYPSASFSVTGQDPATNQVRADLGMTASSYCNMSLY
jgi:outer membrane autotransporter protein